LQIKYGHKNYYNFSSNLKIVKQNKNQQFFNNKGAKEPKEKGSFILRTLA